jgi:autotransporter-associated beta strand protein
MKFSHLRPILFASLALTLTAASAQAQTTLYWGGGTSNVANGTALPTTVAGLTGTWGNSTTNWSSAYSPTVYAAWGNGSVANLGYFTDVSGNANMTISGNKTFNGMVASLAAASSVNRLFTMSATSNTTLTLGGDVARFLISAAGNTNGVVLGGNLSLGASSTILLKDGAGLLQISGNNSDAFTGKVLIRSGQLTKGGGTSLAGVTDFEVSGYRPTATLAQTNGNAGFTAPTLTLNFANTAGNQTQINDDAVINLGNRGTLILAGGNAAGTETIGSLVAQGTGIIENRLGTAGQVVNFGTLGRGTDGRATYIVTTNSDTLAQNIRITNTTGLATNELLPWLSTSRGEWLSINSTNSNQLTRVASTNATLNAANWVSTYNGTSNVRINGAMTNSLTANLSLNSLGFLGTASHSDLNLGGNTLTLDSGALGLGPESQNRNNILSNGTIRTSSSKPLYINTGFSNAANLSLDAILAGNMDIYVSGITTVNFGPVIAAAGTPNTYNGTVYVNSGSLVANKDAAITGNVVVAPGGSLLLGRANATATTSNLTFARDAVFSTGGFQSTLGGVVTMNGSQWFMGNNVNGVNLNNVGIGLVFNGGAVTYSSSANGALNLLTNVSYAASSETQAVFQRVNPSASAANGNFIINLNTGSNAGSANRTFDVADSITLAAGTPEMLIDTVIANGGSGTTTGGLIKTGNGTLMLTGSNTYTGGTTVNGGTLQLGSITAAAQSNLTGTFGSSGVDAEIITFANPITGTMAFGQAVTGSGIGGNRTIAGILNDYQVVVNGSTVGNATSAATNIALGAVNRIGSLSGNVTINSGGTVLVNGNATFSSNSSIAINSGGTLLVDGNTTFSSNSSIAINSGGFFRLGANGTAGSIGTNSTLSNNGTIVFQRSNTLTQGTDFGSGISGTGTLLQAGAGTTILAGTNSFNGTVSVQSGSLVLSGANAVGSSASLVIGNVGATLSVNASQTAGTLSGNGSVLLASGQTLTLASSSNSTFNGQIQGAGNLAKAGTGTLTLAGANTNNGTISISAGTLLFDGANSLSTSVASLNASTAAATLSLADGTTRNSTISGSLSLNASAFRFDLNNTTADFLLVGGNASLTGAGKIQLNLIAAPSSSRTWDLITATGGLTSDWVLDDTSFIPGDFTWSLSTVGSTLRLSADPSLTSLWWSGNQSSLWTTAANWSTNSAGSAASGSAPSSTIDVIFSATVAGNRSTSLGADMSIKSLRIDDSNDVSIAAGNTLTLTGSGAGIITIAAASGTTTIDATLAGGQAGLTKSGLGTLVMNAANSYSGATTLTAGTLQVASLADGGVASSIGNSSSSASNLVLGTATLVYTGSNTTSNRNFTLSDTTSTTLRVDNTSTRLTLTGNSAATTGALVIQGPGTLALSGSNLHSGGTTLANGTLQINSSSALGSGLFTIQGGTIDNTSGAPMVLANSQSWAGDFTFTGSSNLTTADVSLSGNRTVTTVSGILSVNGSVTGGGLTKSGAGTLVLAGNNSYGGSTTVTAGTLRLQGGAAIPDAGALILNNSAGVAVSIQNSETIGSLQGGGLSGGAVSIVANATLTVAETGNQTFAGTISGAGNLTKSGAGTLTLANTMNATGGILISGGTLATGAANIFSSTASIIANSATLRLGGNQSISHFSGSNNNLDLSSYALTINTSGGLNSLIGGLITGTNGTLIKNGASNLGIYSSSNTFSGQTILNAGSITVLNTGTHFGTSTVTINNGTLTIGGVTPAVTTNISNLVVVSGTIQSGGNASNTLTSNGSIIVESGTISLPILGAATLSKQSAGVFVLSGNNTYSGGTTVSAGTLRLSGNGTLGTGAISISGGELDLGAKSLTNTISGFTGGVLSNGTLTANGGNFNVSAGTITAVLAGTNGLAKSASGTVVLSAANTYSGGTTVSAGTLRLSGNGTLGTGAISISGGELDLGAKSLTNTISGLTGGVLSNGTLTANGGNFNVSAGTITAVLAGSNGLVKSGNGTVALSASNSYSGATTVNSGTLQATASGALGNSTVIDVNGGSFLVTAANAVNDTAAINLGGGRMAVSGNFSENVGQLTLSADSIIDFSGFSGVLRFSGVGSWASGANLAIWNWSGTTHYGTQINNYNTPSNLVFTTVTSNLTDNLANISFYSDSGNSFVGSGFEVSGFTGGGSQIIAVPETETYFYAVALLAGLVVQYLGRRAKRKPLEGHRPA